jgi:iron complex outermembrane receptor protein
VAVRGFGARSAFGIRGIRVLRDGVPLTLADGQAAVDFVDLETIGSAEVMRGAAGALYGNASGGVVELRTEPPPAGALRARVRGTLNEDSERLSGHLAGSAGGWGLQGTLTRTTADGPRDYARARATAFTGDLQRRVRQTLFRSQLIVYDSPLGENPGAVTIDELSATPWVADSQNIRRRASKTVQHRQLSLAAERTWSGGGASATLHGGTRELYNPQAFAIVGFDRTMAGISGRVQQSGARGGTVWRVALGADLQSQRDDRRNFVNCAGLSGSARPPATCPTTADRGVETVHQLEKVVGAGVFARAEVTRDALTGVATLRGDRTNFTVRDRRPSANGSVLSLDMGAVSPMLGVTLRRSSDLALYANVATSFETPTTTELANQPDGSAGINRELKPQRGRTLETGIKGAAGRIAYDVALFDIATRDELIPFEIPNSGGRRYFRNAGRTTRRGVELGVQGAAGPLDVAASLAHLVYEYDEFAVGSTVLDGHRVPGVSPTTASLLATLRRQPGFFSVDMQYASRTAADDANANNAPGYVLWNARAGLTGGWFRGVEPVIGIENAFDRHYSANIVTNATRGRFYEPGAGRRVYVAVSVRAGARP